MKKCRGKSTERTRWDSVFATSHIRTPSSPRGHTTFHRRLSEVEISVHDSLRNHTEGISKGFEETLQTYVDPRLQLNWTILGLINEVKDSIRRVLGWLEIYWWRKRN
jgi:hypothetical protein